MEKRKSLNIAIFNYFRSKESCEDLDKFKENQQISAQSPFVSEHTKKNIMEDEFTYKTHYQEKTVIEKLYNILKRMKIKQFALHLLNSTPSRMLKKMTQQQFSIINDKAQDFSDLQKNSKKFVLNQSSISCSLSIFLINVTKSCNSYPVINPTNKYKLVWDIVVSLTLICAFFFIPIMASFSISESEVSFNNILSIVFIILLIDIFINCNTGFYKRGVLCKKREKILNKYFQEQLRVDFISLFPIIIYKFIIINFHYSYESEYILLFILLKWKKLSNLYNDIQHRYILRPNIRNILTLLKLFIIILLIAHSCACLWIVVGRLSKYYYGNDNWIQVIVKGTSWNKIYLYAFYFCTVTMTTVGYGDISPQSPLEFIACTIMVLISAGIFGFSINTIQDILQDFSKNERIIMQKMFIIKKYLLKKSISPDLSKDVSEYLEYCWRQNIESCLEEEEKMVKQLSDQLRNELLIESNKIILKQCLLFQNNFSEDVMKAMVSIIQEKSFTPFEVIFTKGDQNPNRSIYFVQEGIIEIFIPASHTFSKVENQYKSIKRLKKGDYFGEIEFFTDSDRLENVRSINFSKILKIDRNDFLSMIKNYPQDYEQFCYIKERLINSNDYQKIFKKYDSCNSENHTLEKCPYVNFIANKPKVIAMHNRLNYEQNTVNLDKKPENRNQNCNFQQNIKELLITVEQFQEINEEQIEVYNKNYLSYNISKCDFCSSQNLNNQGQAMGNSITFETTSQSQNNDKQHYTPQINNKNQLQNNNNTTTTNCNYNQTNFRTTNSYNITDEQGIQSIISTPKRANLKSSIKTKSFTNKTQTSVTLDECDVFDTISPRKAVKHFKSSLITRKKNNSDLKMSKQAFHHLTQLDSSHLIKSNTELDQGSHGQSSCNVSNSSHSNNPQAMTNSKQDYVISKSNLDSSMIEYIQESMITTLKNSQHEQKLLGSQNNHEQIIFFDLFNGQFDRMQNFLLYYPLNNYSFVIQQSQMDSKQKKKMKNKLISQQKVAILKLIKNKLSSRSLMKQNSDYRIGPNFKQIKRAFDQSDQDLKDKNLKNYKGQTPHSRNQNYNNNYSNYQTPFSASEFKKSSMQDTFSNVYEDKSFRFMNIVEDINDNVMVSSQKQDIPLSASVSKQNILDKDNQEEFMSFQEITQINNKYLNKSDLKNASEEGSTFQQTINLNKEKIKSEKLLNLKNVITSYLNESHDQENVKQQIGGDLSSPQRENRVSAYKQLEIQNNLSAYFENKNGESMNQIN